MIVSDWREFPAPLMRALYEREQEYWRCTLDWDASSAWETIEQARTTWGLPGLIATDSTGTVRGWTFCFFHDGVLEIGGLTTDAGETTDALLDAVMTIAEEAGAERLSLFVCSRAPGLEHALAARDFKVEPHRYLVHSPHAGAPIAPLSTPMEGVRAWAAGDISGAARLLRDAYGDDAERFSPRGTLEEWIRYVKGLVEGPGCGRLLPDASRVIPAADDISALVVLTQIGPRTAHVAQVAVHPERRRQRLAESLVRDACSRASDAGFTSTTLLVAAANEAACTLYGKLGFVQRAWFVAARRAVHPRRFTSVALASGGATTLR